MVDIFLVGSFLGYNLESYVKMELENLGYSVAFFQYDRLLGSLSGPVRMAITRSHALRILFKPLILNKINKKLKAEVIERDPSVLLAIKGEVILPSALDWIRNETETKTALWYPDDPCFFDGFNRHSAPYYDYVFTASSHPYVHARYKRIGAKAVYFLPFACNPSVHKKIDLSEEEKRRYGHDIGFVGTFYLRRFRLLRKLDKYNLGVYGPYWKLLSRKGDFHEGVWGPEMVKVFNASKIVLDIYDPAARDYEVNARIYEATGCGSFTLTERGYGLDELYDIGKEVICYDDEEELQELVQYYLDADEERNEIAINGQERAYEEHTYEKRVRYILNKIAS